ncbi:hypothetical protein [Pseudomonas sp. SDO52101_S400]
MQPVQHGTQTSLEKNIFHASLLNQKFELDLQESSIIIRVLKDHISQRSNDDLVSLKDVIAPRTAGSTLDDAQEFASAALAKMLKSEAFIALQQLYKFSSDPVVSVDKSASIKVLKEGAWINLTYDLQTKYYLQDDLQVIAECAEQSGGFVFAGEFIGIQQWLEFQKYTLPETVSDTKNLIAFLEFKMPARPDTGNYHELLMERPDSPFHLSSDDRLIITSVIAETTQGRNSLLQHIALKNFSIVPEDIRREHAGSYLNSFLSKPDAKKLGRTLLERLEWHLETDEPEVAERQLKCMMATAVILDLMPQVEKQAGEIAGYALYRPDNASRTASEIVKEVENHLIAEKLIESHNAQLAAHLLLAGVAPELLVQGIPVELTIDRPGWVVFAQAVALIELTSPGASRLMSYEEVKSFSDLAPVSQEQLTLHELTAIKPIIHWAMLNGLLPYSGDSDYSTESYAKAASSFGQYAEALNQIESGLSANPPDRRQLALNALKSVMPAGDYLEQRVYKLNYSAALTERSWVEFLASSNLIHLWDSTAAFLGEDDLVVSRVFKLRASILDLYMSDDLVVNRRFNHQFVSTKPLAIPNDAFSRLSELEPLDKLFNDAFDPYYQDLQIGLSSVMKMAITQLPEDSRSFLSNSYVTLYTVRKEVNSLNAFQETQLQRDAEKGRYGIILGCQRDNEFRCYELFTLKGLCRERPDLAAQLQSSGIADSAPTLSYTGADTDFQDKNPERQWPVDASAYLDGSNPTAVAFSRVVVEKLWHFHLQSDDARPVPLFFSPALDKLAEEVLACHPIATREELYALLNTQTDLQKLRAQNEALDTALVNIVIPFKKCIEDIGSGDSTRVTEGIGGCVLDGLALLGLIVGFGAAVAGIVGKTASTTSKVLSIAKAGARFSASLINPLDGLPALALKGTHLVKKGILLLSKHGVSALETATGQLRKLTGGAQSYDLIKAAQKSELLQGTWKASGDLGEPASIIAVERNLNWHALHLGSGGPWGRRLKQFKKIASLPLRQLFNHKNPHSFTRMYLSKAIPIAKTKLDNAIDLLSHAPDEEVRMIVKYVFGNDSDEALGYLIDKLKLMRKDLDSVALSNMSFKKGEHAVAALRPETYDRWSSAIKANTVSAENPEHFLVIYPDGLNDLYKHSKYDDARIADVLVHEMSHGAPKTLDFYYGYMIPGKTGPASIDAAGLIDFAKDAHKANPANMANPHFRSAESDTFKFFKEVSHGHPEIVQKHPALLNADSFALGVALLNQKRTHPERLMWNMYDIQGALTHAQGTSYQFISGELPIQLASI